jgi:hypothetical protein
MYASLQHQHVPVSQLLRWTGRAAGVLLFAAWAVSVAIEVTRPTVISEFAVGTIAQGIALGIAFGGYAIGWRNERVGGVVAILGTLAFVAVVFAATRALPAVATLWFAGPGVLYLFAQHFEHGQLAEQPAR